MFTDANMKIQPEQARSRQGSVDDGAISSRDDVSVQSGQSGLTDFISRRMRGEVPLFGGDPRRGASEFGAAVSQSVQNMQMINANNQVVAAIHMLNRTLNSKRSALNDPLPTFGRQINMVDHEELEEVGLSEAATLDESRLRLLLTNSHVAPEDVQKYYKLLTQTASNIRKKELAMRHKAEANAAKRSDQPVASDEEIAVLSTEAVHRFNAKLTAGVIGIDDVQFKLDLCRAFIHSSVCGGRMTNARLALLGDVAMRLLLYTKCNQRNMTVGTMSTLWSDTQTNATLRLVFGGNQFETMIRFNGVLNDADRKVQATVIEAIYGAAFLSGGMKFVEHIDKEIGVVAAILPMQEVETSPIDEFAK